MYQVLIADDELIERMVLCKTLQKNFEGQCEIYQAANGREALAVFEEKQIQIAILDIEMPGINGLQAAEEIRRRDASCSIIFLTAFDDFGYAKKAIAVRTLDYLLKPCQENELIAVMEEAMRLADKEVVKKTEEGPAVNCLDEARPFRSSLVAENMKAYVRDNYMKDISLQDAAKTMNYSDAYFCKLFKQCFDKNFITYLTEFRIEEAKKLLAEPSTNVKEIGSAVGYPDSNYFAKVFKRVEGVSPSEYRIAIMNKNLEKGGIYKETIKDM